MSLHPTRRPTRRIASLTASVMAFGALSVALAGPAAAATPCPGTNFCAYDGVDYGGGVLLNSVAGRGSNRVDVADDRVSSAVNRTGNRWEGVNVRRGWPDQVVFRFAPNTAVSWVGSGANDKIDHFNVR